MAFSLCLLHFVIWELLLPLVCFSVFLFQQFERDHIRALLDIMSSSDGGDVVLVTGGSGFLGQHIIKLLLEQRQVLGIKEIRSLDIVPYRNNIGHVETPMLRTFVGDIGGDSESLNKVFAGVDGVFHCAASVKIEYPPNYAELQRVNINGEHCDEVLDMLRYTTAMLSFRHPSCGGSVHSEQCETLGLHQLHFGLFCALQGTQYLHCGNQFHRVQDGDTHIG